MSRFATELMRAIEEALGRTQVRAAQIVGQLAGSQVAPAALGVPGVVDLDDVATLPIAVADIDATGTPSASTYLRGDGAWAAASGGGLTIEEADGAPSVGATKLILPNGTLSVSGTEATYTPAAGGGGAPTDASYVTTAASGSLAAAVVIPGLAGSPDRAGVGGAGTSREFLAGDAAPTWTPSAPGTVDVGVTWPSHLYVNGDNNERYGYYSWGPAGAFDARMKASANSLIGLYIGNSDNSGRLITQATYATRVLTVNAFSYAGSWTQRGANWLNTGQPLWHRISRDSGTNITWWFSADGMTWIQIATASLSITVARLGIITTNAEAVVDWIRTSV